ncbi:glycerol-3-phosphate dehydrogenase/oxidase [Marinimicrobium alkaliphilum]|uniref:glycerol-3-phosphate dehydrogenase/oxidase n=1 Tax=Marinimicrobium alkaliphilum TaxID=2202654 RepID=UPI000DBA5139|nr:FAD-dependent oxidoreductase [Marinimicrobium alkaliphilum]
MQYDIVVIGAGIQGAGVAQAAAAAGYSVLVLEQSDIANGTSSKSSKLIHGGLRYLETGQLGLVRESLQERTILLRLAPNLVHLSPLHIPVYRDSARSPFTLAAGLSLYRLLAGMAKEARFSRVPRAEWGDLDGLKTDQLRQVFRYYEAQTDDAALTRAVMRSARALGAELALPARFLQGRIDAEGCDVAYTQGGREHQVRTRVLINAAGPWATELLKHIEPAPPMPAVELVQGAHLLLPPVLNHHYYLEAPADRRGVFALPWQNRLLLGTTETLYTGDPAKAHCLEDEQAYLLETLGHYFPGVNIDPGQMDSFAGLRVLPKGEGSASGRSREVIMAVDRPQQPRLLTLVGGKLTTYRATALQALARVAPSLPRRVPLADTADLPLE